MSVYEILNNGNPISVITPSYCYKGILIGVKDDDGPMFRGLAFDTGIPMIFFYGGKQRISNLIQYYILDREKTGILEVDDQESIHCEDSAIISRGFVKDRNFSRTLENLFVSGQKAEKSNNNQK